MKKATAKYVAKALLLMWGWVLLFRCLTVIFVNQSSYYLYRNFNDQKNVDVLVLGSSHSSCGINAKQMQKTFAEHGQKLSVFNYSPSGTRIEQIYYLANELLKRETPNLIVVETFSFCPIAPGAEEILARWAFDPLPLTLNKIEAIQYLIPGEHWSYYIPFIKYHTRWKDLTKTDFRKLNDSTMWQAWGRSDNTSAEQMEEIDDFFETDIGAVTEQEALNATETECLEKLLALAKQKNIKVLLAAVPFKQQLGMDAIRSVKVNNYVEAAYVDGTDVRLLDMNRMWRELDFGYADLFNEGHTNRTGAQKVTACLTDYILENYDTAAWEG